MRSTDKKPKIYLASVLLEKNRWGSRMPSFRVSDWVHRIADAGFDGIELWEYHVLRADPSEREAISSGPVPVTVLNTYCSFDDDCAPARAASAELAQELDVDAVKFNVYGDPGKAQMYLDNLSAWIVELPPGCRLLCECHKDSLFEEPEEAAKILEGYDGEVEIIVHAFGAENSRLEQWMHIFGTSVTHVHAVIRDRTLARHRIDTLMKAGFAGTWTIEFCEGVYEGIEDMETLMATAINNLIFLQRELA